MRALVVTRVISPVLGFDVPSSAFLDGVEGTAAVLIDDVELVSFQRRLAGRTISLFQPLRGHGTPLIVASRVAVAGLDDLLPDLKSGLRCLRDFDSQVGRWMRLNRC